MPSRQQRSVASFGTWRPFFATYRRAGRFSRNDYGEAEILTNFFRVISTLFPSASLEIQYTGGERMIDVVDKVLQELFMLPICLQGFLCQGTNLHEPISAIAYNGWRTGDVCRWRKTCVCKARNRGKCIQWSGRLCACYMKWGAGDRQSYFNKYHY